jgi:hypothetical protein
MRTIVAVTILAIMISIVAAVGTLALTDNIDARESRSVPAASSSGESEGSGIYTTVCGPDAAHACKTSTGQ